MRFHETVIKLSDGYIDEAIALLQKDTLDETAVHDIRVLMKRLRGLLQLYRMAGERNVVAQLNPVLRDVARTFAAQRDSHVLADTLQQMMGRANKTLARELRSIRAELTQQTAAVAPELSAEKMAQDLVWVRSVWHTSFESIGEQALLDALAQYYRRNRRQGREALRLRDETVLHDWRKRVKYLHYQLCALPMAHDGFADDLERMRKLGSLLGKVHDLDVLMEYLRSEGYQHHKIRRLVQKRRVRLVKQIRRLYRRLFTPKTKDFRRKIAAL